MTARRCLLLARHSCSTSSVPIISIGTFFQLFLSRNLSYFKHEAHEVMVVNLTRADLENRLIQRFGGVGQLETKIILYNKKFNKFLGEWAKQLVASSPSDPLAKGLRAAIENFNVNKLAEELFRDNEVKWLWSRIVTKTTNDCLPLPIYPSVLKVPVPQFPYEPSFIEQVGNTYGLFKWPFKASFKKHEKNNIRGRSVCNNVEKPSKHDRYADTQICGSDENNELYTYNTIENEDTKEHLQGYAKNEALTDNEHKKFSKEMGTWYKQTTISDENSIYSPSEMDTGLHNQYSFWERAQG